MLALLHLHILLFPWDLALFILPFKQFLLLKCCACMLNASASSVQTLLQRKICFGIFQWSDTETEKIKLRKFSSNIVDRISSGLSEIFLPAFQGIKSIIYGNRKPCSGIFQELWTDRTGLNPPGFWTNIVFRLAVDKPQSKWIFLEQISLLGSL